MRSGLYRGHLMHVRCRPVENRFRYPVYQLLIDLAELPELDARLRLFSHGRPNLIALHDHDYLDPAGGLEASVQRYLARHRRPAARRILLLTNPRVLGYVFNPVSFFYCYDDRDRLGSVIAEVNNTFGDSHRYLLDEQSALPGPRAHSHEVDKLLHVSPFMGMNARYRFHFDGLPEPERGSTVTVGMQELERGEAFFTARLELERGPLSDRALAAALLRYPFMTVQVIGLIHYQALKLYLKGAPFFSKPPYDPDLARRLHERRPPDPAPGQAPALAGQPAASAYAPADASAGAEGTGALAPRAPHRSTA